MNTRTSIFEQRDSHNQAPVLRFEQPK